MLNVVEVMNEIENSDDKTLLNLHDDARNLYERSV